MWKPSSRIDLSRCALAILGFLNALGAQEAPANLAAARAEHLVAKHQREATSLYGSGEFDKALVSASRGLELRPDEPKLLHLSAWCLLRLAGYSEPVVSAHRPRRLLSAESAFDKLGEVHGAPRPAGVVLGAGRCQQLLAAYDTPAEARPRLLRAEGAYSVLIDREEQLLEALRFRMEVRFALAAPDGALRDAARYEKQAEDRLHKIAAAAARTRNKGFRLDLEARVAAHRAELWSVQARVALHHWRTGAPEQARAQATTFLAAEHPVFDQEQVAELLIAVAPDDPRVAPAHLFRLQHATGSQARAESALALGRHGGADAATVAALVAALDDPHPVVVREATTALGKLGPGAAAAIPRLEEFAHQPDAEIARRARAALQRIRTK